MTDKNAVKKKYRSKKAVTKCGYCSLEVKEENLENHCKTVHKKPKLAAGQRTLDSLFKPPSVDSIAVATPSASLHHHHPPKKQSWLLKRELVITLMISWSPRLMIKTTTLLLLCLQIFLQFLLRLMKCQKIICFEILHGFPSSIKDSRTC